MNHGDTEAQRNDGKMSETDPEFFTEGNEGNEGNEGGRRRLIAREFFEQEEMAEITERRTTDCTDWHGWKARFPSARLLIHA